MITGDNMLSYRDLLKETEALEILEKKISSIG
jgi:hypothetical protein